MIYSIARSPKHLCLRFDGFNWCFVFNRDGYWSVRIVHVNFDRRVNFGVKVQHDVKDSQALDRLNKGDPLLLNVLTELSLDGVGHILRGDCTKQLPGVSADLALNANGLTVELFS
jgi:hypothetical protein